MINKICLNGLWDFSCKSQSLETLPIEWDNIKIKVPSPFNINSFAAGYQKSICDEEFYVSGADLRMYPEYPEEWEKSDFGFYKRSFYIPSENENRRYFLKFDAVAFKSIIYVNGIQAAKSDEAFLPIEIEITKLIKAGQDNELIVAAQTSKSLRYIEDGKNRIDYPYGSVWGEHIAGIWQDIWLIERSAEYISEVYYYTDIYSHKLYLEYKLNGLNADAEVEVFISEHKKDRFEKLFKVPSDKQNAVYDYIPGKIKLWDTGNPNLYDLKLVLKRGSEVIDTENVRVGFRTFHIENKKFILNGRRINLKNDSWHYMGYSVQTPEYAGSYFKMAKDANVNIIRLHAQPFPDFFAEIADEVGMLIVSESCFWASACIFSFSDDLFKRAEEHVKRLVLRDRNHPSVVMWSAENEGLPVYKLIGSKHIASNEEFCEKMYRVVEAMLEHDKTRPISCDGSEDIGGKIEIYSSHYPGYDRMAPQDKIITIGEMGSMYYSTPDTVNSELGEEAMLSFNGRLEAVAKDAFNMLIGQRKWAAQVCVFNIVWYGLEPLRLNEKIHSYDESEYNTQGINPTRTVPFMRTLNAGLDENLPEYIPNPVFECAKKAYKPVAFYFENAPKAAYASENIGFTVSTFNDSGEDGSFTLHIKQLEQGKVIDESIIETAVESCSYTETPVSLIAGPSESMSVRTVHITLNLNGQTVHSDSFDIDVYNKGYLKKSLSEIEGKINLRVISPDDGEYSVYLKKSNIKNIFVSGNNRLLNNGAQNHRFTLNKNTVAYSFDDYIDFNAAPLLFLGNGAPIMLLHDNEILLSADIKSMTETEPLAAVLLINTIKYSMHKPCSQRKKAYVYTQGRSALVNMLEAVNCDFEIIDKERLYSLLKTQNEEPLFVDNGMDLCFLRHISGNNFSHVSVFNLTKVPDVFSYDFTVCAKNAYHLKSDGSSDFSVSVYSNNLYGLTSGKETRMAENLLECKNHENIVLGIPDIDWRKWNNNAEQIKTVSITKASNPDNSKYAALSRHIYCGSDIYFCQLCPDNDSDHLKNLYVRFLTHLNVRVTPAKMNAVEELLFKEVYRGKIKKSLFKTLSASETVQDLTPRLNFRGSGESVWRKIKTSGTMEGNSALAFYVFSPSDRTHLLYNPDTVSVTVVGTEEFELYLNKEFLSKGSKINIGSLGLLAGYNEIIITTKKAQAFPDIVFERYDRSPVDLIFGLNNSWLQNVSLQSTKITVNDPNGETDRMITGGEYWVSHELQRPGMEIFIYFNEPVKVNGIFFESVMKEFNPTVYTPVNFDVLAGENKEDMNVVYSSLKDEAMSYEDGKIFVTFPQIIANTFSMRLTDKAFKYWIVSDLSLFFS